MTAHTTQLRVRFYELDPYGHVNHSVYIQYFETARVELLSEMGFGLDTMRERDTAFVVTRIATRFLQPAALLDHLVVETGLVSAGRVRSKWAQRIRLAGGDAAQGNIHQRDHQADVVATQIVDFATTNLEGRPRRAPDGLTAAIEPYAVGDDWLGKHHPDAA